MDRQRAIEFPEQVGKGTDVVFVAVGEHHAFDLIGALQQVVEVRVDDIDARLVIGKRDPAVEYEQPSGALDHEAVHPDFPESPEGDDIERLRHVAHFCSCAPWSSRAVAALRRRRWNAARFSRVARQFAI